MQAEKLAEAAAARDHSSAMGKAVSFQLLVTGKPNTFTTCVVRSINRLAIKQLTGP